MTAENRVSPAVHVAGQGASMRPRPMTAENEQAGRLFGCFPAASMRPRPMTAENGLDDRRE